MHRGVCTKVCTKTMEEKPCIKHLSPQMPLNYCASPIVLIVNNPGGIFGAPMGSVTEMPPGKSLPLGGLKVVLNFYKLLHEDLHNRG